MTKPDRFPLGRIVVTDIAATCLSAGQIERSLARHAAGDWGDVCPVTAEENDAAIHQDGTLLIRIRPARADALCHHLR